MNTSHRRRAATRALAACVLLALLWAHTGIALAHARLLRSDPVADTILNTAPAQVHLWFSEDLNSTASRIVVWDRFRHNVAIGDASLVPGHSREMQVGLRPLSHGSYLVLWTSVSSQDGHILRGAFVFSVGKRGPLPSLSGVSFGGTIQTFPDIQTLASILAHWMELLGAVTWVGLAAFSALIFSPSARRASDAVLDAERRLVRRWMAASIVTGALGSVAVLSLLAYNLAGDSWSGVLTHRTVVDLLAEQYTEVWFGRLLLALVALLLTLFMTRRPRPGVTQSYGAGAPAIVGFVYLYALAASGHASSAAIGVIPGGRILSGSIAVDWLHLIGDALWFGGQIYIVLVLIPALLAHQGLGRYSPLFLTTLNRFSPVAYTSIGFFIVSGLFSAKVQIPSWYAFFHSAYGWALIVKIGFIGLMMLTSAVTVYGLRPRIRGLLSLGESASREIGAVLFKRLVYALRINPVLGCCVLLAASVMFYYPVPPGLSPAGPSAYTVRGDGLVVGMTIHPDRAGPNQTVISVRKGSGTPVRGAHVTVLTTMLDMEMGTGLAAFTEAQPGRYVGNMTLGMGGRWRFQILVYQPSGLSRLPVDVQVGS